MPYGEEVIEYMYGLMLSPLTKLFDEKATIKNNIIDENNRKAYPYM
jgi:hypothetical protein